MQTSMVSILRFSAKRHSAAVSITHRTSISNCNLYFSNFTGCLYVTGNQPFHVIESPDFF